MCTYFRGEAKDFGNTSCIPSILRIINTDSALLESERRYYESVKTIMNDHATIEQISEKEEDIKMFYQLTVFQHYGFATRLLDITTSSDIATYFACCSNFDDDGFVFQIENEKAFSNVDREHIKRKMKVIINTEENVIKEDIVGKGGRDSTVSANVIIDNTNSKLDFESLRQRRQKGRFVLFGNIIENNLIKGEFSLLQKNKK